MASRELLLDSPTLGAKLKDGDVWGARDPTLQAPALSG